MTTGSLPAPFVIPLRDPFCGKSKSNIDTNTPIEIHCDLSSEVDVYYTVDGSKPNPFKLASVSLHGVTNKFFRPFRLSAGKQVIRAIVVNENSESPIVTKQFYVEKVEPPHLETDMSEVAADVHRYRKKSMTGKYYESCSVASDDKYSTKVRPKSAAIVKKPGLKMYSVDCDNDDDENSQDNIHRCPYCFYPKIPSKSVHFCYRCGSKLIISNKYHVNTHSNIQRNDDKLESTRSVGTFGDVWMEAREWDVTIKDNSCESCGRNNCRDSRYCDNCGSRLNRQCVSCSSEQNPIHAKFCLQCGSSLERVPSPDLSTKEEPQLERIPSPKSVLKTQSTQTFGLFYPSSKELDAKAREAAKSYYERRLSSRSAGNGFWRQQVDHMCAHLKAYAYNNLEFRKIIGEPRIGSLLYARFKETESGCINILLSFAVEDNGLITKNDVDGIS